MGSKKRCAVVGVGNRAHSWLGGIVNRHPEASELVALCDPVTARCRDVNEAYGTEAAVHDDVDRMLAGTRPDLVIVTSPEGFHREHIVKALEAGCEVATEKPLCVTIADAEAILAAEQRSGRRVFMAFNYRHIPLCAKIREQVKRGAIGTPVSMDLTWYLDYHGHGASYFRRWHRHLAESGGLLVTKAAHHFDLANWWMDDAPRAVFAQGAQRFFGPGHNPYSGERCSTCAHAEACAWYTDVCVRDRTEELSRELGYRVKGVRDYVRDACPFGGDVDICDTMSVLVRYGNGGLLTYSLNASVPYEGWTLAINGTRGRLESRITDNKPSPGWQERHQVTGPDGALLRGKGYRVTDWPAEYRIHVMPHDGDDYEVRLPNIAEGHGGGDLVVMDAVLAGRYPDSDELGLFASAADGARATAVGAAANEAIASGRPVDVPAF